VTVVSHRAAAADRAFDAVKEFIFNSRYGERRTDPDIADFTFGNPQEMPLAGLVAAIREGALPRNKDWFAYKTSEEAPQAFLAEVVGRELDLRFRTAGHRAHRRRFCGNRGRFPACARCR